MLVAVCARRRGRSACEAHPTAALCVGTAASAPRNQSRVALCAHWRSKVLVHLLALAANTERVAFFTAPLELLGVLRERVLANYTVLPLAWLPLPKPLSMQLWKACSKTLFAVAEVATFVRQLGRPAGFAEPAQRPGLRLTGQRGSGAGGSNARCTTHARPFFETFRTSCMG